VTRRRRRSLQITRERVRDEFVYRVRGRTITSASELARIEAIAVPPAWTNVEISRSAHAKVLARGIDAAGRTQAIYHERFRRRQDREKFDRMLRFGRSLPRLRARVDRDLRRRKLSRERVTACVVRLIDVQLFRVGNAAYARRHRSYGVTTLREEHLSTNPSETAVQFDFVGKSGKRHQRRVKDPRVARLIAQLVALPGSDVFRFFDEDEVVHRIRSRHVNAYVKRHMGGEFTAKDFRTWGGTVLVANALLGLDPEELGSVRARASALRGALAVAAERLGNTVAVTRSSYVDPRVLEAAEQPKVLAQVRQQRFRPARYLTREEQLTLRLIAAVRGS
jgi:DNA topoisomerase-1